MKPERTLPDFETDLSALRPGEVAELSRGDFTRLFGVNDAANGRLVNFARLHNCATIWSGENLIFRKRPTTWNRSPDRGEAN